MLDLHTGQFNPRPHSFKVACHSADCARHHGSAVAEGFTSCLCMDQQTPAQPFVRLQAGQEAGLVCVQVLPCSST